VTPSPGSPLYAYKMTYDLLCIFSVGPLALYMHKKLKYLASTVPEIRWVPKFKNLSPEKLVLPGGGGPFEEKRCL